MNYTVLLLITSLAAYGLTGLAPFPSEQPGTLDAFDDMPQDGVADGEDGNKLPGA
jgi:hypothetical protein